MPYMTGPANRHGGVPQGSAPQEEYEVRVTPEQVVLRYGDTIVWDVQGLPAGLADRVSFSNFYLIGTVRAGCLRQEGTAAVQAEGPS